MKNTSLTSDAFSETLQTPVAKMFLVIHLVILVCVSMNAAGFTTTECETIGDVKSSLELAEGFIHRARKNLLSDLQSSLPKDCEDLINNGEKKSGVYLVWPINRIISGSISVYCDMDIDGGGWTVIQRRGNFGRDKDYFFQDWKTYREGFGNLEEDFWLGDSFSHHNDSMFSTIDRDNDEGSASCAVVFRGGWWFKNCLHSNLNGQYIPGKFDSMKHKQGLHWMSWKGTLESLAKSEIKIRRNPSWVK